mmetsp:Transcript_98677/g.276344  ORF Transcript_98677/g.276344 Transcript_98677/m.276344 type:complete len:329 (-) Transcript_98677:99-1085(-)
MGALGKSAPSGAKRWLCCSVVSSLLGCLLIVIGIWGTVLNRRFTPVYRPIRCQVGMPEVKRMWSDRPLMQGLHIQLVSLTVCANPNPYSVKIRGTKSGGLYMGSQMSPVGNITRIPEATLPADGQGTIEADMLISPTKEALGSAAAMALGLTHHVPLYLENNLAIDVDAKVLFAHVKAKRSINKDCGLNLKMSGFLHPVPGPMTCADTWDQLVLLHADAERVNPNELVFSADRLGSDDVDEAEELKTESLAAMMGVGFGLGIVFFIAGGLCLLRYHRLFRRARAADEVCAADGVLEAPVKSPESAIIAPAPAEAWDAQDGEAAAKVEA